MSTATSRFPLMTKNSFVSCVCLVFGITQAGSAFSAEPASWQGSAEMGHTIHELAGKVVKPALKVSGLETAANHGVFGGAGRDLIQQAEANPATALGILGTAAAGAGALGAGGTGAAGADTVGSGFGMGSGEVLAGQGSGLGIGVDPFIGSGLGMASGEVLAGQGSGLGIGVPALGAGAPSLVPGQAESPAAAPAAPTPPATPSAPGAAAPGAATGGAAPTAVTGTTAETAGQSQVDKILGSMRQNAGLIGLGLGAVSLGMAGQQRQIPNEQQLNDLAATGSQAAKDLITSYRSGQISAAQQAGLDQLTQQTKNQINNYFASIGQSDSTAHMQALAQVDQQALAMKQQVLDNMLQQGLSAIGVATGPLNTIANAQIQRDKNLTDAFGNFANAVGQTFGRMSGTTASASPQISGTTPSSGAGQSAPQ